MMKRGRKRREVGVIRDIPVERAPRGAANEDSCESFGPIPSSRSSTGKGKRQHQIVRYRQASFDSAPREPGMIKDDSIALPPERVVIRESCEAHRPIPSFGSFIRERSRQHQLVTYRQSSLPHLSCISPTLSTESDTPITIRDKINDKMKRVTRSQLKIEEKAKEKEKSIQMEALEEGGYVSKPVNFCYIFETHYEGTPSDSAEPRSLSPVSRPYSPTLSKTDSPTKSWILSYDSPIPISPGSYASKRFFHQGDPLDSPTVVHSSEQVQFSEECSTLGISLYQLCERPFDKLFSCPDMPHLEAASDSDNQSWATNSAATSEKTTKR